MNFTAGDSIYMIHGNGGIMFSRCPFGRSFLC